LGRQLRFLKPNHPVRQRHGKPDGWPDRSSASNLTSDTTYSTTGTANVTALNWALISGNFTNGTLTTDSHNATWLTGLGSGDVTNSTLSNITAVGFYRDRRGSSNGSAVEVQFTDFEVGATFIPEPSTAASLLLALGAVAFRRRRSQVQ